MATFTPAEDCHRRTFWTFLLALCFGAGNLFAQARPDESFAWPRAVIVVFERRIPAEIDKAGHAGRRFGELRAEVMRQLVALPLRRGDHVFLFADGTSQIDFDCAAYGASCTGAIDRPQPARWERGVPAAREFLASMLQLPDGTSPAGASRVRGAYGEQFLHLVYSGDDRSIDCAIRSQITGPMTSGRPGGDCAPEGADLDRSQTRAVSRVEVSFPVQVSAALRALGPAPAVSEVTWIWALLAEKNYDRFEALQGIRRDFRNAGPLVDFVDRASNEYSVDKDPKPPVRFSWGGMVRVRRIESNATIALSERLDGHPDWMGLSVGRARRSPLTADLALTTGVFGGPWEPAVDALAFSAALAPPVEGKLLGGRLQVFDGKTLLDDVAVGAPANDELVLVAPHAEERYQRILRSDLHDRGTAFTIRMDMLITGRESPAPYNFPAVPAVHPVFRNVRALRPAFGPREIGGMLFILLLLAAFAYYVFQRHPFHIEVTPSKFAWDVPSRDGKYTLHAGLRGHTNAIFRKGASPANTQIRWEFSSPSAIRVLPGSSPLAVRLGEVVVPSGQWRDAESSWTPGTPSAPTLIQPLTITLNPLAFDTSTFTDAQRLGCSFRLEAKVEPRRRILRLRPANRECWIASEINLTAEEPHPTAFVRVRGEYRQLGLAARDGARFATVIVQNAPRKNGVAREVQARISLTAVESPDCQVVFHLPETPQTCERRIKSGVRVEIELALLPKAGVSGSHGRTVRGLVNVEYRDVLTGKIYAPITCPWTVKWFPVSARVAGLDLGTSGVRLFLENPTSLYRDDPVLWPMSAVNEQDTEEAPEFPSLVRIAEGKGVVRAGGGTYGVFQGSGRLVESPKGALLSALGTKREAQARLDFEDYVRALAQAWREICRNESIENARLVATIPWSYSKRVASWYRELLERYFESTVLVASVREAEAAAYFHIQSTRIVFDPASESDLPVNRKERILVVDAGAGTVDYVVIEGLTTPGDEPNEFTMIARAYSHSAGDRYDEEILRHVFDQDDVAGLLAADPDLRRRLRRYKEQDLPALLSGAGAPALMLKKSTEPNITRPVEFFERMEVWFRSAVSEPLDQIARMLGGGKPLIDEVLLAGRGTLAPGCRDRVERDVARLFSPPRGMKHIPIRTFMGKMLGEAVARGALSYARQVVVQAGDADLRAERDVELVLDFGERQHRERLLSFGDEHTGVRQTRVFGPFPSDIRRAWILAGDAGLTEESVAAAIGRLRTGGVPQRGVEVLDVWRGNHDGRLIRVVIDHDDCASFVEAIGGGE